MALSLSAEERAIAAGGAGDAAAMAMRIVADAARLMGAERLIPIASAHIDGCLYHGDSGTRFAEALVRGGGRVAVPATLNVGALDLIHPERVRAKGQRREMALRLMRAYQALGCRPTWTCAPYQAGHRPQAGEDVAWGESNAVAFCNSVLGARTNRYGDFLDIACAISGRAPAAGLHLAANRRATLLVDASALPRRLVEEESFYPVLGAWLGAEVGTAVAVIEGLPPALPEDRLKALGAAAASTGSVALFHIAGSTPEAPDARTALGGALPRQTIRLKPEALRKARDRLSTVSRGRIDAVALGSPHFSLDEFAHLERLLAGARPTVPFYVCTGRYEVAELERQGRRAALEEAGITLVADTCVVVTPILPEGGGVLMTNSGKFAYYGPGTIGYDVVYGSLKDCVMSAATGQIRRDASLWR